MKRDERLEEISEMIRAGIPVGFREAIEAVNYQGKLKDERQAKSEADKARRRDMAAFLAKRFGAALLLLALAFGVWHGCGWHVVNPTEDELYGCTVEQQAPNGECK